MLEVSTRKYWADFAKCYEDEEWLQKQVYLAFFYCVNKGMSFCKVLENVLIFFLVSDKILSFFFKWTLKGVAKEHICITHGQRLLCGDGQRGGKGDGWRWEKVREGEGVYL